jgi:hypothetical protein
MTGPSPQASTDDPHDAEARVLDIFRLNPRYRHPAMLVRRDGSETPVVLTEYTRMGFRLMVSFRPELGEDVQIRLAGQVDLPGKIRWTHGTEAGGSF